MTNEERLLKVLAGVYTAIVQLGLGNKFGVHREEVNSGIIHLKFKPRNLHQLRSDLDELVANDLVIRNEDNNSIRYFHDKRAEKIVVSIIQVWEDFRRSI
ncbi:MAG: hypothetical protein OEZ01_10590 [Candidatus Heimdallarchaeota archaeon]|nr:hypothetical protein [Candidatus Heimdallarchaeota archaeon]MDH5646448.1 hypothetical protein [Candidatus Heimdallarchaeota archaeon]